VSIACRCRAEDLTDLPDDVAELIQLESVDGVRFSIRPVSVEDELEILTSGARFVNGEIIREDERDGMAGVGGEALEAGNSVSGHGLRDRDVLQNDSKFTSLPSRHHRTSNPASCMPWVRSATYRGSTTRAVPKNCASAVTFSSTHADASGVVR
jgi:hypothetical protein